MLFEILMKAIDDETSPHESGPELVKKVVDEYLALIQKRGVVPAYALPNIVEDLNSEVFEMFRKKTYGFFNLKEIRLKRRDM